MIISSPANTRAMSFEKFVFAAWIVTLINVIVLLIKWVSLVD